MEEGASDSGELTSSTERRPLGSSTVGASLPPLVLSFKDLKFAIRVKKKKPAASEEKKKPGLLRKMDVLNMLKGLKKEKKELLHSVSGHFLPGRLCAIMGPSG